MINYADAKLPVLYPSKNRKPLPGSPPLNHSTRRIGPAKLRGLADTGYGIVVWGDVMPCQVTDERNWQGEKKLCLAILEDAWACAKMPFQATQYSDNRIREEARRWIASTDADYVYDFENVCDVLGLDADYIRAGIFALLEAA